MTNNEQLLTELLEAWEETYKKGQLTLWIFLSMKEGPKYVEEIKAFVESATNNTMTCELQSLYRTVRKFRHVGILDYTTAEGYRGPERKYYSLTNLGSELLAKFLERNIHLFFEKRVRNLINQHID